MKVTEVSGAFEHEGVVRCEDAATGLRSFIALHSTRLGPGLGGTRFFPFNTEEDALADVLKLSRAMTYKSAAAGLSFGGGKAVIVGDPKRDKTEALIRAYARFVDSLDGRYITTEDVGTTEADMILIREQTPHVTGLPTSRGGSGDPSDATAWGVFNAMRSLAKRLWGQDSLEGRHVAVQGVGKVGTYLVGHLVRDGCLVTVADVSPDAVRRVRADHAVAAVGTDDVHEVQCDIFSPCALGGSLNPQTIPGLRCEAVAGCANNQLASEEDAERLMSRGIVYAPDFIVNAGGVINISYEVGRAYDRDAAFAHVGRIGETLTRVLDLAGAERISTAEAAERVAVERIYSTRPNPSG
ncbi:MAG TPA: Glu/Leu/Phe/Val dehydrogenase dimerization domain-containing protein [Actinomycetota bacterium]|jgi:leucine dehydrogenase|nr:Glu/Leu/Phe/Val dehydrogenase dimerization domain-containing protein [Actinomycetota bacterium]